MAKTAQFHVSLPPPLRRQLDEAPKKSGVSVAEEIRSRIEQSFAREVAGGEDDPETIRFLRVVWTMTREIQRITGLSWHQNAGARAALREAISEYLEMGDHANLLDVPHLFNDPRLTPRDAGYEAHMIAAMVHSGPAEPTNEQLTKARQLAARYTAKNR